MRIDKGNLSQYDRRELIAEPVLWATVVHAVGGFAVKQRLNSKTMTKGAIQYLVDNGYATWDHEAVESDTDDPAMANEVLAVASD